MPRFSPEKLARYPHMFARDVEVWEKFLEKHARDYEGFDYDIKVGEGRPPSPFWPVEIKKMNEVLTKKRIDVVGYQKDQIHVIEVKPIASNEAIGQALTYANLFRKELKDPRPVVPAIVTDSEVPDMKTLTKEFGLLYIIVKE